MIEESEVARLSGLREQVLARGDFGLVREIEDHMRRHGIDPAAIDRGDIPAGVFERAVPQGAETVTPVRRGPGRPKKQVV